jgi:hypothetical protein
MPARSWSLCLLLVFGCSGNDTTTGGGGGGTSSSGGGTSSSGGGTSGAGGGTSSSGGGTSGAGGGASASGGGSGGGTSASGGGTGGGTSATGGGTGGGTSATGGGTGGGTSATGGGAGGGTSASGGGTGGGTSAMGGGTGGGTSAMGGGTGGGTSASGGGTGGGSSGCTVTFSGAATATFPCDTARLTYTAANNQAQFSLSGGTQGTGPSITVPIDFTGTPMVGTAVQSTATGANGGVDATAPDGSIYLANVQGSIVRGSWSLDFSALPITTMDSSGDKIFAPHGTLDAVATANTGSGMLTIHVTF